LSGLQIKTALMLGFEAHFGEKITDGFNEPFLADTIYEFGFKFSENIVNDGISPELQNAIDEKIDSNEFDFIDEEEVSKSDFTLDELKEIVQKTFLFENQKITKGMFQYGTDLNNYLCGKIDNKFVLVFLHPINKKWNLIHIFDTEYAANEAAIVFAIYFKKMNIKSEGLYMVEHTLLRPRTTKNFFGIYLLDAKGDKFLYSTNLYTEIERNKILKILKEEIGYYKNYRVERLENGEHQIVFSAADNTIEFLGQNKYTSVQEIYAKLENTFQFLCDKYEIVPFNQKYSMYVQFKKTDDRIEGDFFSHRVSAIMPNWTSRFANPEFRKVAERCIRSLAPAYIGIDFYWISPEQMQRFEKAYMLWKHCFRREKNTVDNVINKRILNYLLQFADSM